MLRRITGISLAWALAVPGLSADDTARPSQSAAPRAATTQTQGPTGEGGRPYKWAGITMIGTGAWVVVAAMFRAGGIEGASFRSCRDYAVTHGLINGCEDERDVNRGLIGLGAGLVTGGVFLARHRAPRSPEIVIGVRRFSVTARFWF
jgi:hypothetical protein